MLLRLLDALEHGTRADAQRLPSLLYEWAGLLSKVHFYDYGSSGDTVELRLLGVDRFSFRFSYWSRTVRGG